MDIHVRKVQVEPQKGRGDVAYMFFETGQFSKPLFVLLEYEMQRLQSEIDEQTQEEE